MGEIFKRKRPAQEFEFTGERFTGSMRGQIEIEHIHRYFLARDWCRDLEVLDIASGEGYGSALIAQVAKRVVGVDVDEAVVGFSQQNYAADNLSFIQGDCQRIPVPDQSFDAVVSFETIEHINEHDAFLTECRRVLRPDGVLIISTPDSAVYSPDGRPANVFHVKELNRSQFENLLSGHFRHVSVVSQRPVHGCVAFSDATKVGNLTTFEKRGEDVYEANNGLARSLYLIAWCSAREITVPSASVYVETSQLEVLAAKNAEVEKQLRSRIAELEANLALARNTQLDGVKDFQAGLEVQKRLLIQHGQLVEAGAAISGASNEDAARLRAELISAREQIARFETSASHLQLNGSEELAALRQQLLEARQRAEIIEQSTTWRATAPLRTALNAVPGTRHFLRRGSRLLWWTVTGQLGKRLEERRTLKRKGLPQHSGSSHLDERSQSRLQAADKRFYGGEISDEMKTVHTRVQDRTMGRLLPRQTLAVTVGIVTYNNDQNELLRLIGSAHSALVRAGGMGKILVLDNGGSTELGPDVEYLESSGNIGFGAAHNRLMQSAFDHGADLYIATNPDGAFHPDCLDQMVRMCSANGGEALIEACQFPAEHPKFYDPVTFQTEWASGACLGIPRRIFEDIGGFDDAFFMYCEDVDFSWRARAAGYPILLNPVALFLHAVTNRPNQAGTWKMMLQSGHLLARKWGNDAFASWTKERLEELGETVPETAPQVVPEPARAVANFDHSFSFSAVRW